MAEVEREDPEKASGSTLRKGVSPHFRQALDHLRSSFSRVLELREDAPSALQQEISITSYHVEQLIGSVESLSRSVSEGQYPSLRDCAASASALREVYSVMMRNALSKR